MAWGLWNKIKQGFKKVGNAVKKAASFVNDKVIKPFKPVITKVADTLLPGSGRIVEAVSDGVDAVANGQIPSALQSKIAGNFRGGAQKLIGFTNEGSDAVRPYRRLNR